MKTDAKILLVDDDMFIQRIIGRSLTQLGYQVEVAGDGLDAWQELDQRPDQFSLVLLDREMPGLDGIALLKRMKDDSRLAHLPVVMLTGADHEDEVAEGLAAGAYYYLTKPATQVVLQRVIEGALDNFLRAQELQQQLGRQRSNLTLMHQALFRYQTLQEARDISLLLADATGDPERTVSGFSELLVNAVEHGNLEISYQEKGELLEQDSWQQEIEKRLQMPPYRSRQVEVQLVREDGMLVVKITDQGPGFDWKKYLEFSPDRVFDVHGRGIAMSRQLCFDELSYNDKGNQAVVQIRLDA